jgi:hypothetical protein
MRSITTFFAATLLLLALSGCKPKPPGTDYSSATSVSVMLRETPKEDGLYVVHPKDEPNNTPKRIVGEDCFLLQPIHGDDAYLYFKFAPSFKKDLALNLKVTVEYYDFERSSFWIEYDGWDKSDDKAGTFTPSPERVKLTGNPTVWLKTVFTMPKARLRNRQEGVADFRIRVDRAPLYVHSVIVERDDHKE